MCVEIKAIKAVVIGIHCKSAFIYDVVCIVNSICDKNLFDYQRMKTDYRNLSPRIVFTTFHSIATSKDTKIILEREIKYPSEASVDIVFPIA